MKLALTHIEALGVIAVRQSISRADFRALAEWLDCYQYVLPANRKLCNELVTRIVHLPTVTSARELFIAWLTIDLIESCLEYHQQERIIKWMIA